MPGTLLGEVLPEPGHDLMVAGQLRPLWAQPHMGYAFRPLTQLCQAWADAFEEEYAAAGAASRIDPGSPGPGSRCSGNCPPQPIARCCCAAICTAATFSPPGHRASDGTPQVNPTWVPFDGICLWLITTTSRRKNRNWQVQPAVALSIIDPDRP